MNGQSADGLFANGRKYFQEFVSARLPFRNVRLPGHRSKRNRLAYGLYVYSADTRHRFFEFYTRGYRFPARIAESLDLVYRTYDRAIRNDSTNKLAALVMLQRYPLYEMEKIKTAARAFGQPYFLPFASPSAMQYAFSIPAKEKVGYRMGKRVLVRSFPEVARWRFLSRDFIPTELKARLIGEAMSDERYRRYFNRQWMAHHKP
jgi:hypothetical protein